MLRTQRRMPKILMLAFACQWMDQTWTPCTASYRSSAPLGVSVQSSITYGYLNSKSSRNNHSLVSVFGLGRYVDETLGPVLHYISSVHTKRTDSPKDGGLVATNMLPNSLPVQDLYCTSCASASQMAGFRSSQPHSLVASSHTHPLQLELLQSD